MQQRQHNVKKLWQRFICERKMLICTFSLRRTTFKLIGDNSQLGKFLGLCVILSATAPRALSHVNMAPNNDENMQNRGTRSCAHKRSCKQEDHPSRSRSRFMIALQRQKRHGPRLLSFILFGEQKKLFWLQKWKEGKTPNSASA